MGSDFIVLFIKYGSLLTSKYSSTCLGTWISSFFIGLFPPRGGLAPGRCIQGGGSSCWGCSCGGTPARDERVGPLGGAGLPFASPGGGLPPGRGIGSGGAGFSPTAEAAADEEAAAAPAASAAVTVDEKAIESDIETKFNKYIDRRASYDHENFKALQKLINNSVPDKYYLKNLKQKIEAFIKNKLDLRSLEFENVNTKLLFDKKELQSKKQPEQEKVELNKKKPGYTSLEKQIQKDEREIKNSFRQLKEEAASTASSAAAPAFEKPPGATSAPAPASSVPAPASSASSASTAAAAPAASASSSVETPSM